MLGRRNPKRAETGRWVYDEDDGGCGPDEDGWLRVVAAAEDVVYAGGWKGRGGWLGRR